MLPTSTHPSPDWFKPSHGRADPRRHLSQWSVEHNAGGELPPSAQVLFHCCDRVEAVGRLELVCGLLDRADPVGPVGADRVRAMGVTQEVPAPVADDDRPGATSASHSLPESLRYVTSTRRRAAMAATSALVVGDLDGPSTGRAQLTRALAAPPLAGRRSRAVPG